MGWWGGLCDKKGKTLSGDDHFYEIEPTLENYWRAIILFGRNVASYKFALAKALFDLRGVKDDLIKLEDLAPVYASHIAEHLKTCDKQATSRQSQFLDICRRFNRGDITRDELVAGTVRLGFNNVIDAFHNVHGDEITQRFYIDERRTGGGIRLTDNFYRLADEAAFIDLNHETESRWRLVETAWDLSLPRHVIQVSYDESDMSLFTKSNLRRISITACRDALNGYQKGRCFYCFRPITLEQDNESSCDVDHFFPHKLKVCAGEKPVDGIVNLVLACKECNRGSEGKFDRIPAKRYLDRLHRRNEYLIKSHHPLKETLMLQSGLTEAQRVSFLQSAYDCSKRTIIHQWEAKQADISCF